MRLRTGHGPQDWSDNIPNCFARISGHTGTSITGELVRGTPGWHEKNRAIEREKKARWRAAKEKA